MTQTLSAADRLRNSARSGRFASTGAPRDDQAGDQDGPVVEPHTKPVTPASPPVPGVFTAKPAIASEPPLSFSSASGGFTAKPVIPAAEFREDSDNSPHGAVASAPATSALKSAAQRLRESAQVEDSSKRTRKEMSAMKTLTRLLEAVYTRPGSAASDEQRMSALTTLSNRSFELGTVVARVAGDDVERSRYVRAMAMEAAVGLTCKSWEQNREIDWAGLIEVTANTPEIFQAADELALASYRSVQTRQDAADRLSISMHSAFWQVVGLGESVDGVTPKTAAEIVKECANYLQSRDRFIADNDLHVSWMQGSIRRITDLVCAEMRARFGETSQAPSKEDISSVLAVARSGFEGVENYAQSILEKTDTPVSGPADR